MSALKLRMPSVMVIGTMSSSTRRRSGSPRPNRGQSQRPWYLCAPASMATSSTVPTSMPQAMASTPSEPWNRAMAAMIVRFQTMETTAGMVKRSKEYRTPLMAPASERKRIVGTRMRRRSAARSAPAAVAVSSGYIHCVSGSAARARSTTARPTTTTISPSRFDASR